MNKKSVAICSTLLTLFASNAIAVSAAPLAVTAVPFEDGGMLAVAAACLVVGIRMIQRKRNC